jgi:hypothetical protein
MRARWIWLGAGLLYGVFSLWYNNLGGPLTPAEIESYVERFEARPGFDSQRAANALAFLEADDGGEFFMVNLIRTPDEPVAMPESGELKPAAEVLEVYTNHFMPRLFARAGHPAFVGPAAGRYLEYWGVEPDPGWTFAGVIRYRSRRDMMELATDPAFDPAHAYKIAAMTNTLAFPVSPALVMLGPRVWVGLLLALLAALAHVVLQSRRRAQT